MGEENRNTDEPWTSFLACEQEWFAGKKYKILKFFKDESLRCSAIDGATEHFLCPAWLNPVLEWSPYAKSPQRTLQHGGCVIPYSFSETQHHSWKRRWGGTVSASGLVLRFLHLQPALWQEHLSFALNHSFFSSSQVWYSRWQQAGQGLGLRKPHEITWKAGKELGSGRTQRHMSVCQHWHSNCREGFAIEQEEWFPMAGGN